MNRIIPADIPDPARDVVVQPGMNSLQTAFGIKDIRELAQDFQGISVDSLWYADSCPLDFFKLIIEEN